MPSPDITQTPPSDWLYVSEGGATIVFSYHGPNNPEFTGTVLRLRKAVRQPPPQPILKPLDVARQWEVEQGGNMDSTAGEEPDDPTISFQDQVTSRLIPFQHLPRLEAAVINKPWLEELARLSEESRPQERRDRDGVDTSRKKAVLATDLVGSDGWTVEIKPKWAFLPSSSHLSPETLPIKTKHCRFCMHARYKADHGDTTAQNYCPLDLFSDDKDRVINALAALWDSWISSNGTVNNLRIFVNGKTLIPSDCSSIPLLASYLIPSEPRPISLSSLRSHFTEALLPLLLETPLLQTLSQLQRTLDPLDIEGLSVLWSKVPNSEATPIDNPVGAMSPEPTMSEWIDFTTKYLMLRDLESAPKGRNTKKSSWGDKLSGFTSKYLHIGQNTRPLDHAKPKLHQLRYYLLAYLLSATFKDCSIMLRLGRDESKEGNTITVIDLDPKSMERLSKWEKLDQKIVSHFATSLANSPEDTYLKRICVDAGS